MRRRVQLLLAGAGVVLMAGMANAAPRTAIRSANISGVGSQVQGGDQTTGACDTTGYDSICPSGSCECFEIPNAKVTGSMAGTGTADVLITGDQGSVTTDLITTNGACMPVYGVAHITSALQKQVLTEDLNLVGAICDKFSPRGDQYIQGGFGIQAGASNGATGWGTVTGTATHSSTPTVTLHLKGPITQ